MLTILINLTKKLSCSSLISDQANCTDVKQCNASLLLKSTNNDDENSTLTTIKTSQIIYNQPEQRKFYVLENIESIELTQNLVINTNNSNDEAFELKNYFYLSKSVFKFLYRNNTFDWICDLMMHDMKLFPIFSSFKYIFLGYFGRINYISQICPIVFKNSYIEKLYLFNLTINNVLHFVDTTNLDQHLLNSLNSTIKNLHIQFSQLNRLNDQLLNKYVFKDLTSLSIEFSNLTCIEKNLFKDSFPNLSKLTLWLSNMGNFLNGSSDDNEWMKYLNFDVNINLTKNTSENDYQLINSNKKQFILEFYDETDSYQYTDNDICLFKHFPHHKLVFPLIRTNNLVLNCTCTLVWLFQHHRYSRINLSHRSIMNCNLDNEYKFKLMMQKCKLNEKMRNCFLEQNDIIENKSTVDYLVVNSCSSCLKIKFKFIILFYFLILLQFKINFS